MERLVGQTGETAMLAIARGPFAVEVVSQVDAPNLLTMAQWVGRPIAPHASAAGKILLEELDGVARRGYAETIDELEDGLSGIVAPVRRNGGTLAAMIGIYGPTPRVCGAQRRQ